jgi:hypothetical protein
LSLSIACLISTLILFSPSQTLSISKFVAVKGLFKLEIDTQKSYQCSKWEVVKEICENLPHISISIPAHTQHMTYLRIWLIKAPPALWMKIRRSGCPTVQIQECLVQS